jgi:hypothetical protein
MNRKVKRILNALLCGVATFLLVLPITCAGLTRHYDRLYPHDGQNGLAALIYGFEVSSLVALVAFCLALIFKFPRFGTDDSIKDQSS